VFANASSSTSGWKQTVEHPSKAFGEPAKAFGAPSIAAHSTDSLYEFMFWEEQASIIFSRAKLPDTCKKSGSIRICAVVDKGRTHDRFAKGTTDRTYSPF